MPHSTTPVRVFISYSHDSPEHDRRVLALANRMREHGVDAWLDRFEPHPPRGWPRWMQDQIAAARFVLVVCTPTYRRRFDGDEVPGQGRGVSWEGQLLGQRLYDASGHNEDIVPVLFDDCDESDIPSALRTYAHYRVPGDYEALYRRVTGQPAVVPVPVGAIRELPAMPTRSGGMPAVASVAADDRATGATGREAALAALLAELFDDASTLRRWAYYHLGNDVYRALPDPAVGLDELIFQTLLAAGPLGRIDAAFFRALARDRPANLDDIRAAAATWLGDDVELAASPTVASGRVEAPGRPRSARSEPASAATASPMPPLWSTRLTLDRITQWGQLTAQCADADGHFTFLVHGDAGQDVHLFVERVQLYLSEQCRREHRICRVLFRDELSTPHTPEEWARRVRMAAGYGHLSVSQALHRASRNEPVLFILGNRTLHGLDAEETDALVGTLAEHLPAWIAAARPEHPIRVLIPIEHAGGDGLTDPLTRAVVQALERGRNAGLPFEHLIQLTFPPWFEVRDHMRRSIGQFDDEFLARCKRAYDQIAGDPDPGQRSFARLADQLHALLSRRRTTDTP